MLQAPQLPTLVDSFVWKSFRIPESEHLFRTSLDIDIFYALLSHPQGQKRYSENNLDQRLLVSEIRMSNVYVVPSLTNSIISNQRSL